MKRFRMRTALVSVVLCASLVTMVPFRAAKADIWGAAYAAAAWKWVQENITRQIEGMVTGALKTAVIQAMNTQIILSIGGNGQSGPMFIVNYEQFLYAQPQQKATAYMSDFFKSVTGGKASSGYKTVAQMDPSQLSGSQKMAQAYARKQWLSEEGVVAGATSSSGAGGSNYYQQLTDAGKRAISGGMCKPDLLEYVSKPEDAFQSFRGLNAYISNQCNRMPVFADMAKSIYQGKLSQQQQINMAMAIAGSGYLPKMQNGHVLTPGSTIKDVVSNAEDVWNKMIAAIDNPSSLSDAVTGYANMAVQSLVKKGVGMAQQYVQGQIQNGMGYIQGQVNAQLGQVGVNASFGTVVGGAPVQANVSKVTGGGAASNWKIIPGGSQKQTDGNSKNDTAPTQKTNSVNNKN